MNYQEADKDFCELKPIECSNCGSAVPLSDGEVAVCVYCRAKVPIPENYRRGNDARRRLASIRARAAEFLARLGNRPKFYEIWIARIPSWVYVLVPAVFVLFLFLRLMSGIEYVISRFIGVYVADTLSPLALAGIYGGSLFAVLLVAMALFFLIRCRVFATRRLMSVLAANMPTTAGGPSTCRRCGSPFMVGAAEMVCVCDYCGAENFLQVPDEWLAATRRFTGASGRNVFWAEREFEREIRMARETFRNQTIVFAALMLVAVGFYSSADQSRVAKYNEIIRGERLTFFSEYGEWPVPKIGEAFTLHGVFRKYPDANIFEYKFPLKRNERVTFSVHESAEPIRVGCRGPFNRILLDVSKNSPASFTADIGGWHHFYFMVKPSKGFPTVQIDLE